MGASLPKVLTNRTLTCVYGLAYAFVVSGNLQVYHTDGLGSVRAVTDGSGNLLDTYQYDGFGNPSQPPSSNSQPFQYTGQQRDGESGLYYLRARMYDPSIGRFLSRDPLGVTIGQPQNLNPYAYAGNSPVTAVDPSGLCPMEADPPECKEYGGTTTGGGGPRATDEGMASVSPAEVVQGAVRWVQERLPGLNNGDAPGDSTTFSLRSSPQQVNTNYTDYQETFYAAYPELRGKVWVHHAVERQVLERYPGRFTAEEIHSLDNLRGIPLATNDRLHLSQIRRAWNVFYRTTPVPTRAEFLQKAAEIDKQFGSEFLPPR